MSRIPKYRDDVKGSVRANIRDFEATLRGEIRNADDFVFDVTDTNAYREYECYLTDAEMEAAFRKIAGHKSIATAEAA